MLAGYFRPLRTQLRTSTTSWLSWTLSLQPLTTYRTINNQHLKKKSFQTAYFFVFAYSRFSTYCSLSLWSTWYPNEIILKRSDFRGCHFETILAAKLCLFDVTKSNLKLAGRRKTYNWLRILHKVRLFYFVSSCWVLFKMVAAMFKFWASLEMNFIRKTCTLRAELWWETKLSRRFLLTLMIYHNIYITNRQATFSFKSQISEAWKTLDLQE